MPWPPMTDAVARQRLHALADHVRAFVGHPFGRTDRGVDRAVRRQHRACLGQLQEAASLAAALAPRQPDQRLQDFLRAGRFVDHDVAVFAALQRLAGLRILHRGRGRRTGQEGDVRERRIELAQDLEQAVDVVAVEQQQADVGPAEILQRARDGVGVLARELLLLGGDLSRAGPVERHAEADGAVGLQLVDHRPERFQRLAWIGRNGVRDVIAAGRELGAAVGLDAAVGRQLVELGEPFAGRCEDREADPEGAACGPAPWSARSSAARRIGGTIAADRRVGGLPSREIVVSRGGDRS